MKKKILLVADTHVHITLCYYRLLSSEYDVNIYYSSKYRNIINFYLTKKSEFFNYPEGLIFFFLIFKSFKYNYIFLITGPQEFNRIKGLLGIFGYFIFAFFHGKKTIMGIRDNNKYFRNNFKDLKEKFLNFIRNKSLKKIHCLFFETRSLLINFKKKINIKKLNCLTIYPLHFVNKKIKINKLSSKILRIGVVGMVTNQRRNYNLLIKAINLLDEKSQKKIILVLLGSVENFIKNLLVQRIQKKIKSKIIYQKNYIKEIKYKKLVHSCHILLSINKKNYGTNHKGTGSFFDAISSKKRLIINFHSDRQFEFKKFCYYYSDANQLSKILNLFFIDINKFRSLKKNVFTEYNNNQIKYDLKKLL